MKELYIAPYLDNRCITSFKRYTTTTSGRMLNVFLYTNEYQRQQLWDNGQWPDAGRRTILCYRTGTHFCCIWACPLGKFTFGLRVDTEQHVYPHSLFKIYTVPILLTKGCKRVRQLVYTLIRLYRLIWTRTVHNHNFDLYIFPFLRSFNHSREYLHIHVYCDVQNV